MTTQQKTSAIQAVVANHQDNVAAMRAANVGPGLESLVLEAMNTAFKDDRAGVFAADSSGVMPGAQRVTAAANVKRKRET